MPVLRALCAFRVIFVTTWVCQQGISHMSVSSVWNVTDRALSVCVVVHLFTTFFHAFILNSVRIKYQIALPRWLKDDEVKQAGELIVVYVKFIARLHVFSKPFIGAVNYETIVMWSGFNILMSVLEEDLSPRFSGFLKESVINMLPEDVCFVCLQGCLLDPQQVCTWFCAV